MCKKIGILFLTIITFTFVACGKGKEVKEINISVATSLSEPINEMMKEYSSNNSEIKININSASSGTLKKQITQGADVGIFFTADEEYMNDLIKEGFVYEEDKINPITNELILIKSNSSDKKIEGFSSLLDSDLTIALGDFNTVPVGKYAKEALQSVGVWNDIKDKIIYGNGAKVVKSYVERGEVDCGIIYKSDGNSLENSTIVMEIPKDIHEKIIYSIAPIKGYKYEEECRKIIEFINSNEGKKIFEKYGFTIME